VPALFMLLIVVGGYGAFCYGDQRLHSLVKGAVSIAAVFLAARWAAIQVREWFRIGRHRRRIDRLQALCNKLARGTIEGVGFYSGGETSVSGVLDGVAVELSLHFGRRAVATYSLRLEADALELEATRPGLARRLLGGGAVYGRLEGPRDRVLDDLAGRVVLDHRLERVTVIGRSIRATKPFSERDLERAFETCRALLALGRCRTPARSDVQRPRDSSASRARAR